MRAFGKLHRRDLSLVPQSDMEIALHRHSSTTASAFMT